MLSEFAVLEVWRIEDFMTEGQAESRTSSKLGFSHFSRACLSIRGNNNNINSQLDSTIIILLIISISSTRFGRSFRPSSEALDLIYSLLYKACCLLAGWTVPYTTRCKHSLVFLRMGEIIPRNVLRWLKLLIKLLLLHLVGSLHCCINDAQSHKHQICGSVCFPAVVSRVNAHILI